MHRMSPSQGVGAALAYPQVLELALILQLNHSLHSLLNWRLVVHSMTIIEVDRREPKPLEGLLAGCFAICGSAVNCSSAIRQCHIGEFRCQKDVLALAWVLGEPLAQEILRVHVHVGSVLCRVGYQSSALT